MGFAVASFTGGAIGSVLMMFLGDVADVEVVLLASVRHWQRPSRIGLGFRMSVRFWLRGELRTSSPSPHLIFIALCDAPSPCRVGRHRAQKALGPIYIRRSTNTFKASRWLMG